MTASASGHGLLAAVLVLLLSCRPQAAATAGPATGAPVRKAQPRDAWPRVIVSSPSGRNTVVDVEMARTPAELGRGLMFREKLPPGTGMLFLFPTDEDHVFWMKNTLIPLDMIFIAAGGAVVGVLEQVEPLTTEPRSVGAPSRYVLEVPGGFAAERGIRGA